jgi:hypothetical protein
MKLLIALITLNVALILMPPLVALPPVRQTPAMLAAAHLALTLAPITSLALAAILAFRLLSRRTWAMLSLLVVAIACSALSRMNLLERVFAPVRDAQTAAITDFHDIRDTDMVIGVVIGGQSRAYPVRYLAYHHMLNDQLGPTALLPTY